VIQEYKTLNSLLSRYFLRKMEKLAGISERLAARVGPDDCDLGELCAQIRSIRQKRP